MVCSGNTLQICGGPYGLTLYQTTNNIAVKNSSSISMSSVTTLRTIVSSSSNSPSILPSNSTSSTLITPSYLRQVLPLLPPFPPPAPASQHRLPPAQHQHGPIRAASLTAPPASLPAPPPPPQHDHLHLPVLPPRLRLPARRSRICVPVLLWQLQYLEHRMHDGLRG